jgi:hypothetical protein
VARGDRRQRGHHRVVDRLELAGGERRHLGDPVVGVGEEGEQVGPLVAPEPGAGQQLEGAPSHGRIAVGERQVEVGGGGRAHADEGRQRERPERRVGVTRRRACPGLVALESGTSNRDVAREIYPWTHGGGGSLDSPGSPVGDP